MLRTEGDIGGLYSKSMTVRGMLVERSLARTDESLPVTPNR